jgi:hypothetical protein
MSIYKLRASFESKRPVIDFENPKFGRYDWLKIGKVLRGELDVSEYPSDISIATQYRDSEKTKSWHFFSNSGLLGILSETLLELIGVSNLFGLQPLPVIVDDVKCFQLRIARRADWIDFEKSEVERLQTGTIVRASKLVCLADKLPAESVFVNQGLQMLFVTKLIAERISDVRGVRLVAMSD